MLRRILFPSLVALLALAAALAPRPAAARVRLENICTVYGQHEVKLTGIGLVVGLAGTGDGGRSIPAIRSLAAALKLMNTPTQVAELKDAKNVAIVLIEATIPRTGLRRGQTIDCHVSSIMGAKSLRGGRLLVTPLEASAVGSDLVMGLASGAVFVEDADVPTSGKVPNGATLEKNFVAPFIDKERGHVVTLLLDSAHSSFHAASEVARVVNAEFSFEAGSEQLARAVGPGVVEVALPEQYRDAAVEFIAQVLEVGIDNPHTAARVVVNEKTGVVVVTGEVEISPVVVSHKNLTVEIGDGGDGEVVPAAAWAPLGGQFNPSSTRQLKELVTALEQLRVPTSDIIAILRELHRSGKLHATFDDH
ncbi:MAG: flagellar basal body P-ring protein FlgI [Planctomycetales bacterium]